VCQFSRLLECYPVPILAGNYVSLITIQNISSITTIRAGSSAMNMGEPKSIPRNLKKVLLKSKINWDDMMRAYGERNRKVNSSKI
jgi:hypothetical protein